MVCSCKNYYIVIKKEQSTSADESMDGSHRYHKKQRNSDTIRLLLDNSPYLKFKDREIRKCLALVGQFTARQGQAEAFGVTDCSIS